MTRPIIVGYKADNHSLCCPCAEREYVPSLYLSDEAYDVRDRGDCRITPIFSTFEFPDTLSCAACGVGIPVVVLPWCNKCQENHHGSRHPQRRMSHAKREEAFA